MVPKAKHCMRSHHWIAFAICYLVFFVIAPAVRSLAAPIQWSQNGHFYDIIAVPDGITWEQAQFDAMARGGYLATITSAGEQDFIFQNLVNNPAFWDFDFEPPFENLAAGPWIGAFQPPGSHEPAGGWQWVHGEGLLEETYANWGPWSPDQYQGTKQDAVVFFDSNPFDPPKISSDWDDWQPELRAPSYVIEFDEDPLAPSTVHYRGGDTGSVTVRIGGSGFTEGSTARLMRTGEADIVGTPVTVGDEGRIITATFDLTGKTRGLWDVVVINPDGTSTILPNGFIIEEGRAPQVWVDILGSDVIRPGQEQTFIVLYGNYGNVDAVGVPLWITGITKDATVKLGFEVTPPLALGGQPTPIDWSQVPILLESTQGKFLPLFVPRIPPGITKVLAISLIVPTTQSFQLRTWVNPPFFGSPLNPEADECLKAIAFLIVSTAVPGINCAVDIGLLFNDLLNNSADNNENTIYSLGQMMINVAVTALHCSLDFIPGLDIVNLVGSVTAATVEILGNVLDGTTTVLECTEAFLTMDEQITEVQVVIEGDCTDIAGEWNVSETGTITCIFDGITETEILSGTRTINIEQDGCNVHWTVPDFGLNVDRTGTVQENSIRVSGPSVVPLVGSATFTQNAFIGQGRITGNEFALDGSGIATGTADGVNFSCSSTSRAVFTRSGEEGACADIAGMWSGIYSEIYCDGEEYSGTWRGTFGSDCSAAIVVDEGGVFDGTVVDNVLRASGEDPECGIVSASGTISGDSLSGAYTYSLGGDGTFSGHKLK